MGPRGTDEANVPEAAIAYVAAAGTSETSERPPTVAAMAATGTGKTNGRPPAIAAVAATGEAASDVSKVVFPFKVAPAACVPASIGHVVPYGGTASYGVARPLYFGPQARSLPHPVLETEFDAILWLLGMRETLEQPVRGPRPTGRRHPPKIAVRSSQCRERVAPALVL
jgi:hypothetical protein